MSALSERYLVSAGQEIRRQSIRQMTDCGIWKEQAEYIMDTLFTVDAPAFDDFLTQHADLARALWPVKRHCECLTPD